MHIKETLICEYGNVYYDLQCTVSETNKENILTRFMGRIPGFITFAKETEL